MGKMETALRDEIARLARREVRAGVEPLNRQIRELKGQVRTLRRVTAKGKSVAAVKPPPLKLPPAKEVEAARIGPRWLRALRKRNKISQGQLAALIGVSLSAVGSWEYGRARPQGVNRTRLVALRGMSKQEVRSMIRGG